jgi:hypothetical protein
MISSPNGPSSEISDLQSIRSAEIDQLFTFVRHREDHTLDYQAEVTQRLNALPNVRLRLFLCTRCS